MAVVLALIARDPAPLAAALAALLAARGKSVHLAAAPGPEGRFDPARDPDPGHAALALHAPLWTGATLAGAVAAASPGADAVIALGPARGAALTIGDVARRWAWSPRVDVTILTGPAQRASGPSVQALPRLIETGMDWRGTRLIVAAPAADLAVIAAALARAGAVVAGTAPLDPGGPVPRALLTRLRAEAMARRARIAAPEATLLRLPANLRREALALPLRLGFPAPGPLTDRLAALGL